MPYLLYFEIQLRNKLIDYNESLFILKRIVKDCNFDVASGLPSFVDVAVAVLRQVYFLSSVVPKVHFEYVLGKNLKCVFDDSFYKDFSNYILLVC